MCYYFSLVLFVSDAEERAQPVLRGTTGEAKNWDGERSRKVCIITIIQLYFRPQWVHRRNKTKTQNMKYYLTKQLCLIHISFHRLYKVANAVQVRCGIYMYIMLRTLCVIKLTDTSSLQRRLYTSSNSCLTTIDIIGSKHVTCAAPRSLHAWFETNYCKKQ